MVFIKDPVTHLHPKWYAHSILPLAPRAKQPPLHIHTCNQYRIQQRKHLIGCHSNKNTRYTGLWNSTGFIWQPEEVSGVDRTCSCGFCLVHVRFVCREGGDFVMSERVRNCSHVMGRYVSQQCQMRICCYIKPYAWNSLQCSIYIKNLILGRGLKHNKNYFKILNIFSFNICIFSSSSLTKRTIQ